MYRHWRAVQTSECQKCAAPTWSGYDNDEVAIRAVVDLGVFLTHEGERAAILDDLETWSYTRAPRRIQWRTPWHRQTLRAGSPTLVVVQHRCVRVVPGGQRHRPPRSSHTEVQTQVDPPF